MNELKWDLSKSEKLKRERGVSFEEIVQAKLVAAMKHTSRAHQNVLLFEYHGYIWVVPYVTNKNGIFLKTLFPSRKYTKIWKKGGIL